MRKMLLAAASAVWALAAYASGPIDFQLGVTQHGEKSDTARVSVYLPDSTSTGRAVVILPGGGYTHLAMDHEGRQWAPWFNERGIAVAVVKYRMPHGDRSLPIGDAEAAIRLVREHAAEWGINPADVGLMGFSAGGHLCSTVATHAPADARPDFTILMYPVVTMDAANTHGGSRHNLLGAEPSDSLVAEYSNQLRVDSLTPPSFIALSHDDNVVPPCNGIDYYRALLEAGVPASLHVYPTGGHGWGIRESFTYHDDVLHSLDAWLKNR